MNNKYCKWLDDKAEAYCEFNTNRQYNLDRHQQDLHEKPEEQRYRQYRLDIQEKRVQDIFSSESSMSIIHRYSKSTVHTILVPIVPGWTYDPSHPFAALEDPTVLQRVREEALILQQCVAVELRKIYGRLIFLNSTATQLLQSKGEAVLNEEAELLEGEMLPEGRDWKKDVMVGVHANPSMDIFHIHVISKDLVSKNIKHKSHYNAFATRFFINLDEFPLSAQEIRRRELGIHWDLKCWRCGLNLEAWSFLLGVGTDCHLGCFDSSFAKSNASPTHKCLVSK